MTIQKSDIRVLLVANYLPDHQRSMQRYSSLLADGLHAAGVDVSIVRPRQLLGRFAPQGSRLQRLFGYADKFLIFPVVLWFRVREFMRLSGGVVHILDQGNGVYLQLLRNVPHVLTCHDLIAVRARSGLESIGDPAVKRPSLYQASNLRALRRARWIACASEASRQDCIRYLGTTPDRCSVVFNPLDPFFLQSGSAERPSNLPARYLLHVGNSGWYKNRPGLLRIYRELRNLGCELPLVLLGEPLNQSELALAQSLDIILHVRVVDSPDDALVRSAYAHADALVFPSMQEGFGWPILEALSQGTIVFTTNAVPMTEVGGRAAWYIDPAQPRQAAQLVMEVLGTRLGDPTVSAAGRSQASAFSMERFIAGYLCLYQVVLANSFSSKDTV